MSAMTGWPTFRLFLVMQSDENDATTYRHKLTHDVIKSANIYAPITAAKFKSAYHKVPRQPL